MSIAPPQLYLQIIDPAGTAMARPLRGEALTIGRAVENDLSLPSSSLSRYHARLELRRDGTLTITDLASKNGVLINGRRLTSHTAVPLTAEDNLEICGYRMRILTRSAAAAIQDPVQEKPPSQTSMMVDVIEASAIRSQLLSAAPPAVSPGRGEDLELPTAEFLSAAVDLLDTRDLDEVSQRVLDFVFRVVGFDAGYIVTWDPETQALEVEATRSLLGAGAPPAISRTIVSDAATSKKPVLMLDSQADTRYDQAQSIIGLGIRTAIAAPMLGDDETVLGVIYVSRLGDARRYREPDARVLAYVAAIAALRFQNARLHEEALEKRFLAGELSVGAKIQEDLLPRSVPQLTGYEITPYYQPCRIMGGDFYDCRELANGQLYFYLGDVSGKGVGAAMLMFSVVTVLRTLGGSLVERPSMSRLVQRANQSLTATMSHGRFATALAGTLDARTGHIACTNAGQPAMVIHGSGKVEEIPPHGTPLGLFQDETYEEATFVLEPGDVFFVYSDGLPEARSGLGSFYGQERLIELMQKLRHLPAEEISKRLQITFADFTGPRLSSDDMTFLILMRK